ncbi:sensor domain-containing diguanylate cyclase [Meiothermus rufus]|uniref:sensor domain-containing diguanylate cyclase n=1 Tax=Meiothermus rufus TaxID=604332 RepID=UPI0003FEB13F|nr:sensor domain-containing diguanylate cyclase [Meiothermus rufus]
MPRRHLAQVYLISGLALLAYVLVHLLGPFLPLSVAPTSLYALPWLMMALATLASSLGWLWALPLAGLAWGVEALGHGLGQALWLLPVLAATLYLADRVGHSLRRAHRRLAWLLEASEQVSRATRFDELVEALPRLLAPLARFVEVWQRDAQADLLTDLPLRKATLSYHPSVGLRLVAAWNSAHALGQMALLEQLDRAGGFTLVLSVEGEGLYLLRLVTARPLSPTEAKSLERFADMVGQRLTRLQGREQAAFLQRLSELLEQADRDALEDGLEALCHFLQLEAGFIFKQRGSRLLLLVSRGDTAGLMALYPEGIPFAEGPGWQVLATGEARFTSRYWLEPDAPPHLAQAGVGGLALLPVPTGPHRARHLLVLAQREAHWWTEGERRLLLAAARILGRALQRQEMLVQRETILGLSQKAHQGLEEGLYQEILQKAVERVPGAEAGSLLVWEDSSYRYKAALGYDLVTFRGLAFSEDQVFRWYDQDQQSWLQGEPRLLQGEALRRVIQAESQGIAGLEEAGRLEQIQASLALPVAYRGRVVALLNLENLHDARAFAEDSLEAARFFAEPIGALIYGLHQRALLEATARTDPLTGLGNRRAFDQDFAQELNRAERYGYSLSLLVLDLQNFKPVNDRLGHAAGDQALQRVAQVLRQHTRDSDRVYRWGGDEFALLLPHTDASGAKTLATHLAEQIASVALGGIHLGASFGLASFPQDGADFDSLLSLADTRMYQAKTRGVALI